MSDDEFGGDMDDGDFGGDDIDGDDIDEGDMEVNNKTQKQGCIFCGRLVTGHQLKIFVWKV